jgi:hypothetical protein
MVPPTSVARSLSFLDRYTNLLIAIGLILYGGRVNDEGLPLVTARAS